MLKIMRLSALVLFLFFAFRPSAFGAEPTRPTTSPPQEALNSKDAIAPVVILPPAKDTNNPSAQQLLEKSEPTTAKEMRENAIGYGFINYSHVDLILPAKLGASVGWQANTAYGVEMEYLRAKIKAPAFLEDLGEMSEHRTSLLVRSYGLRNSFNFFYGINYNSFQLTIGNALLARLSSQSIPSVDLIQVDSLGFTLGVGNRWLLAKNFSLGVDWASWSQPVVIFNKKNEFLNYVTNQKDKEDVEKAITAISYLPRLAFLKVQIGFFF